jgi:HlyD family secretion protein
MIARPSPVPEDPAPGSGEHTGGSPFKRKILWVAAGIVVALGALGWMRVRAAKSQEVLRFETVKLDKGRVVARVTASGTLSAIVTVQVGSQVSGTIAALYADFNSTVKKGQLVAKIDPRLFDAAVQQARANLVAAEGNLLKARAQAVDAGRIAQRSAVLVARKLIAQADADTAQATADAAKAAVDAAAGTVEQAKAQLSQSKLNLDYTDIRSPKDGTVISRNVDVGQTVAASLQAPVLFLIAEDLRKMQVDTSVAEADIGKLQAGMPATFTVDAYQNERFRGSVRQVRNAPQTVQNVVTYDAVIDVDNTDLKLKPGMTANCTFVYASRENVLRVPSAALRFRPPAEMLPPVGTAPIVAAGAAATPAGSMGQAGAGGQGAASPGSRSAEVPAASGRGSAEGGRRGPGGGGPGGSRPEPARKTVWVLANGKPRAVTIKTGVSDGSMAEVTDVVDGELKEGDFVITDVSGSSAKPAAVQSPQGPNFPRRMF